MRDFEQEIREQLRHVNWIYSSLKHSVSMGDMVSYHDVLPVYLQELDVLNQMYQDQYDASNSKTTEP